MGLSSDVVSWADLLALVLSVLALVAASQSHIRTRPALLRI